MVSRVFISYARLDKPTAERLYRDLKSAGLQPWLDTKDLLPGQNWRVVVTREIRQARFFLALLSNHSVSKIGFVQEELKVALEVLAQYPVDESFIIPVRLEECIARDHRLQELHWVDLFPSYENGLGQILKALRGKYSGKIVLHVEDEQAYEMLLRNSFEPLVRYKRVSLLSEATQFLSDTNVVHFILDLRLPFETLHDYEGWGDYPRTTIGLIRKIRHQRPDASVTILTNYPNDPGVKELIEEKLLSENEVISKITLAEKDFSDEILTRIMLRP